MENPKLKIFGKVLHCSATWLYVQSLTIALEILDETPLENNNPVGKQQSTLLVIGLLNTERESKLFDSPKSETVI